MKTTCVGLGGSYISGDSDCVSDKTSCTTGAECTDQFCSDDGFCEDGAGVSDAGVDAGVDAVEVETACNDGKDNDRDRGVDYLGACDSDADRKVDVNCFDESITNRDACRTYCVEELGYTYIKFDSDCTSSLVDSEEGVSAVSTETVAKECDYTDITVEAIDDGYRTIGSMALDSFDDTPSFTYWSVDSSSQVLNYASFEDFSLSIETIESQSDSSAGYISHLVYGSSGVPHIIYYQNLDDELRYATLTSGSWEIKELSSDSSIGLESSLAVDSQDRVHFVYYSSPNSELIYGILEDGVLTSETLGTFSENVDLWDIALDSEGQPHIVYYYKTATELVFRSLVKEDGNWESEEENSESLA